MPEPIEPLLHRRTDLSTFLVHLTRDREEVSAKANLVSILTDRVIEAKTVYGMATAWATSDATVAETQKCVCLSEAPLEHVWMLTRNIEGRQVRMRPYGIVFTKAWGREKRINPVWYLDITPGHTWLTNPVNELVQQARDAGLGPDDAPVLRLTPFIEQMGPMTNGSKKEFWWEREWRRVGDLAFTWRQVVAVFAPAAEHEDIVATLATAKGQSIDWVRSRLDLLDPEWGMERMIARLAGVDPEYTGPLPRQ